MSGDCKEPVQAPASNEVEKTNNKKLSEEETRMRTAYEQLLQNSAEQEESRGLCQEPVQAPASNEVEKTNNKKSSEEETRMRTADEQLLQNSATQEESRGLCQNYPLIWIGDLFLKKFEVRMEMRFVYGDPAVFKNAAPSIAFANPGIYVKKKIKFDNLPQIYIKQKMEAKTVSCVLIALPSDSKAAQCLQRFFNYFNRTKSVGVSLLPQDGKPAVGPIHAPFFCCYEMLLFPPSEFAHQNVLPLASQLMDTLYRNRTPHLMIVVSAFYCMRCAKLLQRCAGI